MKNCENCKFALFQDTGYSNYTVEGTNFHCLRGAHPAGTFDRFYGEDKHFEYAEQCTEFSGGQPTEIDCDRDAHPYDGSRTLGQSYSNDPQVIALIDKWDSSK